MVMVAKGPLAQPKVRELRVSQPPLPSWVKEVFPQQARAVREVVREFDGGAKVVFLDAPTGSGKSLVGELARRELDVARGLYVCTTKSLQQQVVDAFPYARVVKGRSNYIPTNQQGIAMKPWAGGNRGTIGADIITCADCDASPSGVTAEEQSCSYCEFVEDCPYGVARREALGASVGVLNTSYLLAECNGPGKFRGRELVVADEADMLEGELLGFVELRLGMKWLSRFGLVVPKKGSHMTTIRKWLEEEVLATFKDQLPAMRRQRGLEGRREVLRLERLCDDVRRVVAREDGWVRDGDEEGKRDGLVLKPVSVEDVAARYLWNHANRWLCMTGTLVSAEMEAESLGLEAAGIPWAKVTVPMGFDKSNRRVVYAGVASMTRKGQEAGGVARLLRGIDRVLEKEPGVNVLVHCHTYKLAKEISEHVKAGVDGRPVLTYEAARDRDVVLEKFRAKAGEGGAVLVAASMDRGVDLPGDACRCQIVCKMPYASLGDRQVSERLRQPGGQLWYLVQTVRSLMQMTGRAVRGDEDWAVTYILDESFGKLLRDGKRLGLFPEWWLEALEVGRVREFV